MEQELSITVNQALLATFVLGLAVGLGSGGLIFGTDVGLTGAATGNPDDTQADNTEDNTEDRGEPDLEGAHTMGDPDAEVTLVEYSSMTCPFCGRHHEQTHPELKEEYIESDEIQYAYKHFARNQVDVVLGNAAECAGDQGKFFEYVNMAFENQDEASQENMVKWAEQLDLNMDEWKECHQNRKYEDKIKEDTQEGQSLGVKGTPGFLVNGELISGAQPLTVFKGKIDSKLEG